MTGGEIPNWLRVHDETRPAPEETLRIGDVFRDGSTFDKRASTFLEYDQIAKDSAKLAKDLKAGLVQDLQKYTRGRSNRYIINAKYTDVAHWRSLRIHRYIACPGFQDCKNRRDGAN